MKKWQIIIISVVCAVAALIIGGVSFYRYYIVPKYLEPVVNKVSEYLSDDEVLED